MDIREMIDGAIERKLMEYGIPKREGITPDTRCKMCGDFNEPNMDYQGNSNGFTQHDVGYCLNHLRWRIEQLEAEVR